MEGHVVYGPSEHPCQVFRQNILAGCLIAAKQDIFTLQQGGNSHLKNLFSEEGHIRFGDAPFHLIRYRIISPEALEPLL